MAEAAAAKKTISARKLAILALLAAKDSHGKSGQPISGITRLQKLVFLLHKRLPKVSPDRPIHFDFAFEPQRFGPADLKLYPDLDFLIALKHVHRDPEPLDPDALSGTVANEGAGRAVEDATEDELSFEYLMGDEEGAADIAAAERDSEEVYTITPAGLDLLGKIGAAVAGKQGEVYQAILDTATEVRRIYGDLSLPQLLRYVYTQYPEMTTNSEIRDRVLGGR